jgi:hypothetical protein
VGRFVGRFACPRLFYRRPAIDGAKRSPFRIAESVIRQSYFDLVQFWEREQGETWSTFAEMHFSRIVEPNHLQRSLEGPRLLTGACPPNPQKHPPMMVRTPPETPPPAAPPGRAEPSSARETCMNKGIEAIVVTSPAPSRELLSARTAPVATRLAPTPKPTPNEREPTS